MKPISHFDKKQQTNTSLTEEKKESHKVSSEKHESIEKTEKIEETVVEQ